MNKLFFVIMVITLLSCEKEEEFQLKYISCIKVDTLKVNKNSPLQVGDTLLFTFEYTFTEKDPYIAHGLLLQNSTIASHFVVFSRPDVARYENNDDTVKIVNNVAYGQSKVVIQSKGFIIPNKAFRIFTHVDGQYRPVKNYQYKEFNFQFSGLKDSQGAIAIVR